MDAVGTFADRRDAGVAQQAGRTRLLDETHATMHLDAERGDIDAGIGGKGFGDWRQQGGALLPMSRLAWIAMRHVDRLGTQT